MSPDGFSQHSIASSPTASPASLHNPSTGLQLCTGACEVTAPLWSCLETQERIALQSICYFVNSDLRWYLKDLSEIASPQHGIENAESETATEDALHSDDSASHFADSEDGLVYHALPRIAG